MTNWGKDRMARMVERNELTDNGFDVPQYGRCGAFWQGISGAGAGLAGMPSGAAERARRNRDGFYPKPGTPIRIGASLVMLW